MGRPRPFISTRESPQLPPSVASFILSPWAGSDSQRLSPTRRAEGQATSLAATCQRTLHELGGLPRLLDLASHATPVLPRDVPLLEELAKASWSLHQSKPEGSALCHLHACTALVASPSSQAAYIPDEHGRQERARLRNLLITALDGAGPLALPDDLQHFSAYERALMDVNTLGSPTDAVRFSRELWSRVDGLVEMTPSRKFGFLVNWVDWLRRACCVEKDDQDDTDDMTLLANLLRRTRLDLQDDADPALIAELEDMGHLVLERFKQLGAESVRQVRLPVVGE